jgi:hypothetical protein
LQKIEVRKPVAKRSELKRERSERAKSEAVPAAKPKQASDKCFAPNKAPSLCKGMPDRKQSSSAPALVGTSNQREICD